MSLATLNVQNDAFDVPYFALKFNMGPRRKSIHVVPVHLCTAPRLWNDAAGRVEPTTFGRVDCSRVVVVVCI